MFIASYCHPVPPEDRKLRLHTKNHSSEVGSLSSQHFWQQAFKAKRQSKPAFSGSSYPFWKLSGLFSHFKTCFCFSRNCFIFFRAGRNPFFPILQPAGCGEYSLTEEDDNRLILLTACVSFSFQHVNPLALHFKI